MENLTIFVEEHDEDGELKGIYIKDEKDLENYIKKIKPPATNVRKIANTGVKKKIALDG